MNNTHENHFNLIMDGLERQMNEAQSREDANARQLALNEIQRVVTEFQFELDQFAYVFVLWRQIKCLKIAKSKKSKFDLQNTDG